MFSLSCVSINKMSLFLEQLGIIRLCTYLLGTIKNSFLIDVCIICSFLMQIME